MKEKKQSKNIKEPVSLESQERLLQILNDSPSIAKFANTEWEIKALKPQVIYLIAAEAVKQEKIANANIGDVLIGMVQNFDSVVRCITLALLNDKKRIEEEYDTIFETIKWESKMHDWGGLMSEILQLLDVGFFFLTTDVIQTFRAMTTERKIKREEAKSLLHEQSLGK